MDKSIVILFLLVLVVIVVCLLLKPMIQNKFKFSNIGKFKFPVDAVITFRGEKLDLNHRREGYNYEIKYCLRAISKNMPWIRKIYILQNSDARVPSFFSDKYESNNVLLYNDNEVIPSKYLPTTNSNSIETFLTLLPDLSENFIYFNDDIFVRKEVPVDYFFTSTGVPKRPIFPVVYHKQIGKNEISAPPSPGMWYPHVPIAYTKSEIDEYINKYPDFIEYIRSIRTRKNDGHYQCYKLGLLYPCLQLHASINYQGKGLTNELEIMASDYYAFPRDLPFIKLGRKKFFCVNDESTGSMEERIANRNRFRKIMEDIFPEKSRAEIDQFGYGYEYFGAGIKTDRKIREKVFKKVINILNTNEIEYFVNYGTLLGLIREGRLLESDDDIDILVHEKDYNKAYSLINKEYTLMRTDPDFCQGYIHQGQVELYKYTVENGKVIDKWTKKHNDLSGIQPVNYVYPIQSKYIEILGIQVSLPNEPEKILENVYENWKVPTGSKGFKTRQNLHQSLRS